MKVVRFSQDRDSVRVAVYHTMGYGFDSHDFFVHKIFHSSGAGRNDYMEAKHHGPKIICSLILVCQLYGYIVCIYRLENITEISQLFAFQLCFFCRPKTLFHM